MSRKIIFSVATTLFLALSALCLPQGTLQAQDQQVQVKDISNEVIILVCQHLEKEKIATAATAMDWYRSGQLTITKIESGAYSVAYPAGGGGVTILIIDAF